MILARLEIAPRKPGITEAMINKMEKKRNVETTNRRLNNLL